MRRVDEPTTVARGRTMRFFITWALLAAHFATAEDTCPSTCQGSYTCDEIDTYYGTSANGCDYQGANLVSIGCDCSGCQCDSPVSDFGLVCVEGRVVAPTLLLVRTRGWRWSCAANQVALWRAD